MCWHGLAKAHLSESVVRGLVTLICARLSACVYFFTSLSVFLIHFACVCVCVCVCGCVCGCVHACYLLSTAIKQVCQRTGTV